MAQNGTADRTRHVARIDRYNRRTSSNPHFLTSGFRDGAIERATLFEKRLVVMR
jgi:hypothetical protein